MKKLFEIIVNIFDVGIFLLFLVLYLSIEIYNRGWWALITIPCLMLLGIVIGILLMLADSYTKYVLTFGTFKGYIKYLKSLNK